MGRFRFECELCDATVRGSTVEGVRERAVTHLEDDHLAQLRAEFDDTLGGEPCRNDCGYVFPADDVTGYDCPECGHDNFRAFARQYLFWRIEDRS